MKKTIGTIAVVITTGLLLLSGCAKTKLSDFAGEWESSNGQYPTLSIKPDGTGVGTFIFSDGANQSMTITRIQIQQKDNVFFINLSYSDGRGISTELNFTLNLSNDKNTLELLEESKGFKSTLIRK